MTTFASNASDVVRARPAESRPESGRGRALCLVFALLGLVVSGYLTGRALVLMSGSLPSGDICSAVFGTGCDEVLLRADGRFLGTPVASWGLAYFATIAVLLVLGWACPEDFAAASRVAVGGVATLGLGLSGLLAWQMLVGAAPHCPLCWVTHWLNAALAIAAWRTEGGLAKLANQIFAAIRYAAGGAVADPLAAKRSVVYLLFAILVGGLIYQWSYVQVALRTAPAGQLDPRAVIAGYDRASPVSIQPDREDPCWGEPDAKARLVVFSDFQCPACRRLAADLGGLRRQYGRDLSIVFKHYPLSSKCNASMHRDMHPAACEAALASVAAAEQGCFWEFHDALFDSDGLNASAQVGDNWLGEIARNCVADLKAFDADRRNPAAAAKLRRDITEGDRLNIDGTPTVFLNGRRLPAADRRTLEILIRHVTRQDVAGVHGAAANEGGNAGR